MTSTITICDTCKRPEWDERGIEKRDGEALAELIETAAAGVDGVATRRHSCLMGCGKGCNLAIQQNGKLTYVMGGYEANEEHAAGIVEYARLHNESETGQVPFRQWPQSVKGHFVSRIPVLPE